MPGFDADSPWMSGMRKRSRLYYGLLAVLLIVDTTIIGGIFYLFSGLGRSGAPIGGMRSLSIGIMMVSFMLVSFLIPAIMFVYQLRRHQRLMVDVPREGGNICPFCRKVMVRRGEDLLGCEKCDKEEPAEDIHDYWIVHGQSIYGAVRWLQEYQANHGKGVKGVHARFRKKIADNPIFAVLYCVVIFAVISLPLAYFTSQNYAAVVINYIPMMLLMGGVFIIGLFQARRKGQEKHCFACEYQCPPSGPSPERCPECGANWQATGAFVKGARIKAGRKEVAGVIMILLGGFLMISPLLNMNWQSRLLPTNSLIAQISSKGGFTYDEWNDLRLRRLSPEQMLTLAQGLLDKRIRKGYISADADNWLVAQIKAGTLTDDLVERYYLEYLEFSLGGLKRSRIGAKVPIKMKSTYRNSSSGANDTPFVFMGDFRMDGVVVPGTRAEYVISGVSMDQHNAALYHTFRTSGQVRVELDVWLVFAPFNSLNGSIIWQDDGTPVIPPGTSWSRKITLEHVIEISE